MAPAMSTGSSPDPLSMSRDTHQPGLTPIKSPIRNLRVRTNGQQALRESSPNVSRTPSPDKKPHNASSPLKPSHPIAFSISSPSRTPTEMDQGSEQSPLKIKLAFGRKSESEVQNNGQSNTGHKKRNKVSVAVDEENAKTTTVPLRGGDEHSPIQTRRRSSRNSGAAVDSDQVASLDALGPPQKRGRGRPRKSLPQATDVADSHAYDNTVNDLSWNNDSQNDRGTSTRRDVASLTPLHVKMGAGLENSKPNEAMTPFGQPRTRSKKISQRVPTPRRPADFDESNLSPVPESSPTKTDAQRKEAIQLETGIQSNHLRTGMEDDTVLLNLSAAESEGFSMVSLDSLKSHREKAEKEAQLAREKETSTRSNVMQADSSSTEKAQARKDGQITHRHRQRTPSANLTRTTSPPKILSSPAKPSPAKISPAVRAGAALQRALTEDRQLGPARSFQKVVTPTSTQDQRPFLEGFGDRSNRELRAGLAMGELLARTQTGYQKESSHTSNSNVARPPAPIAFSRLPTPAESQLPSSDDSKNAHAREVNDDTLGYKTYDQMSWKPTTPPSKGNSNYEGRSGYDEMSWRATTPPARLATDHQERSLIGQSTLLEQEIQREREEVIRQAQHANTSQVIIIDSNENSRVEEQDSTIADATMHDVDAVADIWQEEAERSLEESGCSDIASRKERKRKLSESVLDNTPDWRDLIAEDTRPPRAKLPRTWRRESGNHFLYSDEAISPAGPKISSIPLPPQKSSVSNLKLYFQDQRGIEEDDNSLPYRKPEEVVPRKGILSSPMRGKTPNKEVRFEKMNNSSDGNIHMEVPASRPSATTFDKSAPAHGSSQNELSGDDQLPEPIYGSQNLRIEKGDTHEAAGYFSDLPEFDDSFEIEPSDELASQDIDETVYRQVTEKNPATNNSNNDSSIFDSPLLSAVNSRQTFDPSKGADSSAPGNHSHQKDSALVPSQQNTGDIKEHSQSIKPVAEPGLFSRIKSWLYPPPPPPPCREWTLNHYLLLGPYYQRSKLPNAPTGPIPSEFKRYIDKVYLATHEGKLYRHAITPPRVFAAAAFTAEVRERGVPLLTDGREGVQPWWVKQYIDENGKEVKVCPKGVHYPIRDENGRVKRVQQEWGTRDVIIRVFSLVCQDELLANNAREAAEAEKRLRRELLDHSSDDESDDSTEHEYDEDEGYGARESISDTENEEEGEEDFSGDDDEQDDEQDVEDEAEDENESDDVLVKTEEDDDDNTFGVDKGYYY